MAGAAFATSDDVAARWRPLTDTEADTASVLLEDASAMIRSQYPGVDSEIGTGQVDAYVLVSVAANMVKRAMIGITVSDGASQMSQTVGPFGQSTTYANPTGNLYITATEDQFIRGYQPKGQSHNYANDTTRCGGDGYFPIVYGSGV